MLSVCQYYFLTKSYAEVYRLLKNMAVYEFDFRSGKIDFFISVFFALTTKQSAALNFATLHVMPRRENEECLYVPKVPSLLFTYPDISGLMREAKKIISNIHFKDLLTHSKFLIQHNQNMKACLFFFTILH